MTEFQVGDQVSIGGTVTAIERPRKKLRVGSVWEYTGPTGHARWLVLDDQTLIKLTPPKGIGAQVGDQVPRSEVTIDYSPDFWREVPVEELEREAS